MKYPKDWIVKENGNNSIWVSNKDDETLIIGVKNATDTVKITKSGTVVVNDLVKRGDVEFLQQSVEKDVLVFKGNDMSVMYNQAREIPRGNLVFALSLDKTIVCPASINTPCPKILSPTSESIADKILSTFKVLDQNQTTDTSNWKAYTNTKYGYQLRFPQDWSSYVPSTDQQTLDSICLGQDPNKCVLNITVLEGTYWDREQKLLGLTLSSKEGTKVVSFAGANGFRRVGYFGETGSLYGFVTILQKNNKVYKIWAYQKTEDQSDYTSEIDQILSTFKFN